ncbi:MAG: hypothetical protein RR141_03380 [Rikenellaceae bacterium]
MTNNRKHIETLINFANIAERSSIIISICGATTTSTIITTPRGV